ncbi:hypothetical protein ACU4GA_29065 [Methylobacterium oryzae CBMB20]
MSDDKTIDGTAREVREPEAAGPASRAVPRRTWVVGAVALPLALGALGLSLAQGTPFQPTPVAPVAIQALAPRARPPSRARSRRSSATSSWCRTGPGRPSSRRAARARAAASSPRARP